METGSLDLASVDQQLETLVPWVVDPDIAVPVHVVTFVRVARSRGIDLPQPRAPYARALFRLADGDGQFREITDGLEPDTASIVLKDAVGFVSASHAVALSDALADRKLVPGPRVAAQLARVSMPKCLELLSRLARIVDGRIPCIESVTAAYLSAFGVGPVASELVAIWASLEQRYPGDADLAAARLEVLAIERPQQALEALATALDDHGASALLNVAAGVVGAAMRHDRDATLDFADEGWPLQRALVLEGIALTEPSAPEIPVLFDRILDDWQDPGVRVDRSRGGTVRLLFPLLRAAISARDFDRAHAVVAALQPSSFMLSAATWKPMRSINITDRIWRPHVWDELVAATRGADEAVVSSLPPAIGAAAWKLETLPFADLPWFDTKHL